ncbi:JNK-interacting protein 3 isoform X2 [Nymphalis io]|uniref:JNK-interacting protein 3 isoform X2 n=1 Tax=Inachis io TaxID=171585 RepID=UPI00216A1654|nr:JNK-interacting protein 3 isoform X2 [Nymphalis io]
MNFDDSASSGYATAETVYGTHEDSHVVMSEKVQSLAGSIYQEFEKMIARYDEDVVKTLMPLLVNVLECLDSAYQTNQEHEVELELLREDNEQLVTQYEREKSARKHSEQKLLEAEDHYEGERKDLTGRLEALDSIVRMLELKHKNSLDHASRLEERENELKKEYAKLHERYTELFKTHMDYMERTKLLLSTASDRSEVRGRLGLNPVGRSTGPISFGFASLEGSVHAVEQTESIPGSPVSLSSSPPSPPIGAELAAVRTVERAHQTDPIRQQSQATSPVAPPTGGSRSQTKSEKRSANTLYQELAFHDTDVTIAEGDEGADITGSWVHPGEYASSGMGKEVENLILENNELLATKNALNVVKDDLIVKVDELTGEQEILREEVSALSAARERLRERVSQLEEELRHLREAVGAGGGAAGAGGGAGGGAHEDDEADVPMAQRRKFTRVEMARVLMERNQYKERFMELQDAVRWTEMVRASRVDSTMDKKNKQGIWKFFSKLFSTSERPQRPLSTPQLRAVAAPQPPLRHSRTQADFLETQLSDHHHRRHDHARCDQFRQVRAHVRKEDGRTQAYGWSLPCKSGQAQRGALSLSSGGVPVPVPVFCRPIAESEPQMTLLCAAGVDRGGGRTPDGGCMVGDSVFYDGRDKKHDAMCLAYEMSKAQGSNSPEVEQGDEQLPSSPEAPVENTLSSLVWICANTQNKGIVMIIDANNPADVIESFPVSDKHILCVASVPGALDDDYRELRERDAPPASPAHAQAHNDAETKRHSQSLFCVGKSDSTDSQSNGTVTNNSNGTGENGEKEVVVGSTKLVQATLLTPPSTPATESPPQQPPPTAARGNSDAAKEPSVNSEPETESGNADSPPLSSTPINAITEARNSPEPGVDAFAQEQSEALTEEGKQAEETMRDRKMSTVMATMWLGTKSGELYVHSAIGNYSKCLARVNLNDAILSIVWCASRCVVALADGTIAIFARLPDGQWDFSQYWLMTLGDPKCSVRCLSAVGSAVWCGYRNRVLVVEPRSRRLLHSLEAHPRHESQVRQMAAHRDGVWVSIKMDSALRLYHAHTYAHLKDVDIEPYVSKMLGTGKLGFSLVRITALLISSGRLWIGTSNGVVISVPLSEGTPAAGAASAANCLVPTSLVTASGSVATTRSPIPGHAALVRAGSVAPGDCIPHCSMAHAQLSFHGHREAVTFFVAVPGAAQQNSPDSPPPPAPQPSTSPTQRHSATAATLVNSAAPPMLVISGGEGYIDFRIADSEMEESVVVAEDGSSSGHSSLAERATRSHLIVWQVAAA